MKLVLDTNIIVSFFRQNPVNFIISNSKSLNISLYCSPYNIKELEENEKEILKYGNINKKQFKEKLANLLSLVKLVPEDDFKNLKEKAKNISPHDKDIPIFALALHLESLIWSNEPAFKNQNEIKIFSTRDMIELFL
jgi:predicted nucleic acid-binding protein